MLGALIIFSMAVVPGRTGPPEFKPAGAGV